jgi:hypothetical protein
MSTSRAKQIAQKRKSKTKKCGNGTKANYAKKKRMRRGPKHLTGLTKKRR